MKTLTITLIFTSLAGVLLGCYLGSIEILLLNLIPTFAIPVVVAINILRDREKPSNDYSNKLNRTKNLRK